MNAPTLDAHVVAATARYRRASAKLHEVIQDCIDGGRLTEADLPDDLMAIRHHCAELTEATKQLDTANGTRPATALAVAPGDCAEMAELMATAADRFTDTLDNPQEKRHYDDSEIESMIAKRNRATYWSNVFRAAEPVATQATAVVDLVPNMLVGLGRDREVSLLVVVDNITSSSFDFTVINGGWCGRWQAGKITGDIIDPAQVDVVYVAVKPLQGSYDTALACIDQELAAGYVCPALRHAATGAFIMTPTSQGT